MTTIPAFLKVEAPAACHWVRESQTGLVATVPSPFRYFLVTGVVVLNVLLAQQALQVRTLSGHITELQGKGVEMTDRVASLSAPGRIQMWATAHGMVTPPDVFVLPVPGAGGGGHP